MHKKNKRAQQYHSFDALKGFKQLLKQSQTTYEERMDLFPEAENDLNECLMSLKKGDYVKVIHYQKHQYVTTKGDVRCISLSLRSITVAYEMIRFQNIKEIQKIEKN